MRKQNLRNKLALHTECTSLQKRSYTTYYIMTYTKYSTRNGLEMGKGKEHLLGSVECTELWGTKLEWSCCASAIQLVKLSCYQPYVSEEQKDKSSVIPRDARYFLLQISIKCFTNFMQGVKAQHSHHWKHHQTNRRNSILRKCHP